MFREITEYSTYSSLWHQKSAAQCVMLLVVYFINDVCSTYGYSSHFYSYLAI